MEGNIIPPEFSAGGNINWGGNTADFVEFVMLLTDFTICIKQTQNISKLDFNRLCDSLGDPLISLFKVDTAPYRNFKELRKNTTLTYEFTRRVINQLNRLKEDEEFYALLDEKGITPSYEYMTDEIIKWQKVESFATFLWIYLNV